MRNTLLDEMRRELKNLNITLRRRRYRAGTPTDDRHVFIDGCIVTAIDDVIPRLQSERYATTREMAALWTSVRPTLEKVDFGSEPNVAIAISSRIAEDGRFQTFSYRSIEHLHSIIFLQLLMSIVEQQSTQELESPMHSAAVNQLAKVVQLDAQSIAIHACGWAKYFDSDPAGVFQRMATDSRRDYMVALDAIAIRTHQSPSVLAEMYLNQCQRFMEADGSADDPRAHIGFYLQQDHRDYLSGTCVYLGWSLGHCGRAVAYLSMLSMWSVCVTAIVVNALDIRSAFISICTFVVTLIGSRGVVEVAAGRLTGERLLPAIDYSMGLPDDLVVAIVVPLLLSSRSQIDEALNALEKNFVNANDTNVIAVVLADFVDAQQRDPTDAEVALVEHLKQSILCLNQRYRRWGGDRFGTVLRKRRFSSTERQWMGWERKRGKIEDFFRISRGEKPVDCTADAVASRADVAYAMVVDDDCLIERDAIQRLSGVLNHPLNRWRHGEPADTSGYAVVIPNTYTLLESVRHWTCPSLITGPLRSFGSEPLATRNFLVDAFGRTHYPGKGLMNIDAFLHLAVGVIPPNVTLSHDTIEGGLLPCAYDGHTAIGEGFPSTFGRFIHRNHRWIRGDWQNILVVWLMLSEAAVRFPVTFWITFVGQILNHLAKPLFVIVLFAFTLGRCPWLGIVLIAAISCQSSLFYLISRDTRLPLMRTMSLGWWRIKACNLWWTLLQGLHNVAASAYEAAMVLDAGATTLVNIIHGRNLLRWTPASVAEYRTDAPWSVLAITLLIGSSALSTAILLQLPSLSLLGMAWISAPIFWILTSRRLQNV